MHNLHPCVILSTRYKCATGVYFCPCEWCFRNIPGEQICSMFEGSANVLHPDANLHCGVFWSYERKGLSNRLILKDKCFLSFKTNFNRNRVRL